MQSLYITFIVRNVVVWSVFLGDVVYYLNNKQNMRRKTSTGQKDYRPECSDILSSDLTGTDSRDKIIVR